VVRASPQELTGGVGVSEVTADLQRIGWGPVALNAQMTWGPTCSFRSATPGGSTVAWSSACRSRAALSGSRTPSVPRMGRCLAGGTTSRRWTTSTTG
jgi:hypothetical protein